MEKAYAMYLRKSRKDAAGESVEETLARHEQRLQQLAQQQGLVIGTVYREVVSGDSIAARPESEGSIRGFWSQSWSDWPGAIRRTKGSSLRRFNAAVPALSPRRKPTTRTMNLMKSTSNLVCL